MTGAVGGKRARAGEGERGRAWSWIEDVGGVVATWAVLVAVENVVVALGWSEQFTGSWEMAHARRYVSPIAVAAMAPLAVGAVIVGRWVAARRARRVAFVVGALAFAVAVGLSEGRHMASLAVRVPFVVGLGIAAALGAGLTVARAPLGRTRWLAGIGAPVALVAWLADAFVLPRLYPAFHVAMLGLALAGAAAVWPAVRGGRAARRVAHSALVIAVLGAPWTPHAARVLAGDDNLRRVLVEHAPILGRAVLLASRVAPPPPLDDEAASESALATHADRSLDWTGRDVVLVTIDALRADHVTSYGYSRPTTPNIDRLAARGARFERAYCPTPHTSYSLASMMTGKYMRPLLSMGAGEDAETWATYLRRYGFRTAAFYPPAVFFIDAHRFRTMAESGLGFEYRKEEFAPPPLRIAQIEEYVRDVPSGMPLFLWVHLFEPHEPYVRHPEHSFGDGDGVDAYDGEVALADDTVGAIVAIVERRRPGAVVVVTADHGEEFGDHGGRYHGTTVYEEQVRVPLVIVGPGVKPRVVSTPVQTIDLLPTTLAALDVPRPARVRGRDLGPILVGHPPANDEGLAFAEIDDYTLVARGEDRLVCLRKIGACSLFDLRRDPEETKPVVDRPARVEELRRLGAAIERENGKLEAAGLPDALRRGLQGDREAAEEVVSLLDDARVDIRREAARCAFRLHAFETALQLRRALDKDEDDEVRRWSALALTRMGKGALERQDGDEVANHLTVNSLQSTNEGLRLGAALALGERGDGRGEGELVRRWAAAFGPSSGQPGELAEAREIASALSVLRARSATPALTRSLEDVRLRPYVVDALGAIGDPRAEGPLLAAFAGERYVNLRAREAEVLLGLGARDALFEPLARFAGVGEPMPSVLRLARDAGVLVVARGGWLAAPSAPRGPAHADLNLRVPGRGPARLLVATSAAGGELAVRVDGARVDGARAAGAASVESSGGWVVELPGVGARARVELDHPSGIAAVWLVRRAEEIQPQ